MLLIQTAKLRRFGNTLHTIQLLQKGKTINMKITDLLLLMFILVFAFVGCKEEKKKAETKTEIIIDPNIETASYEIVKIEDKSRKAFGKKSLSQYTTSEIESLPINKKILYRVVLSQDIKESHVIPTVEEIIDKLTSSDSDIDEIILWLYSNEDISNSAYDIGSAIWAPFGKLGNIDADIAKNNNRDNYKIDFQIKNNLDDYLTLKSKSEIKFGFTEKERKQIFKEIVGAEDKAHAVESLEQEKAMDRILGKQGKFDDNNREMLKAEYNKISERTEKLMSEYKSNVFKQYKITKQQADEISMEGLNKNWPLE